MNDDTNLENCFCNLCDAACEQLEAWAESGEVQIGAGEDLEPLVLKALKEIASEENFPFKDKITLISQNHTFPDIQVGDRFGVEVKSSQKGWSVPGGSIIESSRKKGIEVIRVIFANEKERPAKFKQRLYQDCVKNVGVTHAPRYMLDMTLKSGESFFDQIGIDYEDIRKDPVKSLRESILKKEKVGGSWLSDFVTPDDISPVEIRLFSSLPDDEKERLKAEILVLYPIIFEKSNSSKYVDPVVYLLSKYSVVSPQFRDLFTAGGKKEFEGKTYSALFYRVLESKDSILEAMRSLDLSVIRDAFKKPKLRRDEVLPTWIDLIKEYITEDSTGYEDFLDRISSW